MPVTTSSARPIGALDALVPILIDEGARRVLTHVPAMAVAKPRDLA